MAATPEIDIIMQVRTETLELSVSLSAFLFLHTLSYRVPSHPRDLLKNYFRDGVRLNFLEREGEDLYMYVCCVICTRNSIFNEILHTITYHRSQVKVDL